MKDLTTYRLNLGLISKFTRPLKDYVKHVIRTTEGDVPEEYRKFVLDRLTAECYFPVNFNDYVAAWDSMQGTWQSVAVSGTLNRIKSIMDNFSDLYTMPLSDFNEVMKNLRAYWQHWDTEIDAVVLALKNHYKALSQSTIYQSKKSIKDTNVVFHAIKNEYARQILEEQKIYGRTTQRYWADGRRRKESEPDYNASYWMKGISTTRCLEFAQNWGGVVLALDLDKIKKTKPVEPYSWNFQLAKSSGNFKKEREEFVILYKGNKRYTNQENPAWVKDYEGILDTPENPDMDPKDWADFQNKVREEQSRVNLEDLKAPEGELDISKCLLGVFLVGYIVDIYGIDDAVVQYVINHPKFLGILEN